MNVINDGRVGTYILAQQSTGYVKIGSTTNLENRIKRLQTGSPFKLYPLLWVPNINMESHLQKMFKPWLAINEWYKSSEEMDDFIQDYQHKHIIPEPVSIEEPSEPQIAESSLFVPFLFEELSPQINTGKEPEEKEPEKPLDDKKLEHARPYLISRHKMILGELLMIPETQRIDLKARCDRAYNMTLSSVSFAHDLDLLAVVGLVNLWESKRKGKKLKIKMISLDEDIDRNVLYDFVNSKGKGW